MTIEEVITEFTIEEVNDTELEIQEGYLISQNLSSLSVSSVFGRTGAVIAATNDYTWAQINKATSSIADITNKSHTLLTDIGTNTHSQIDTAITASTNHIASISNPHSVSKSQVGLGSVPNTDCTNPANIVQDATHRFTTDTEKGIWNGKQDALGFTPENVSNKKTTLTDSDTDYPTTKAVNTGLGTKSDTSHNHSGVYQPVGSYEVTTNKETSALDTSVTKYPNNAVVKAATDALAHASFYAGTMTVNTGTLNAGTVADLQAVGGTDVDIQEVTGADPLRVTFDFTAVTRLSGFAFYGNYNGGGTHQMSVEVYNTGTTNWDVLGILGIDTVKAWYSFPIFNTSAYINAGAVSVRLRHVQNGNATHKLILDYLELNYGGAGGQSNISASSIVNTPSGSISATNLQSAINELDSEKEPLKGADDNYVTDAQLIVIGNTSGTNSGNETAASIATIMTGAGAETPLDDDEFSFYKIVGTILKKVTWSTIKTTLKTYFDGYYFLKTVFTAADEIQVGTGSGTTNQITLAASQFLGKKATGAVTNLTASEARTILNVADGANVSKTTATLTRWIVWHLNGEIKTTDVLKPYIVAKDTNEVVKMTAWKGAINSGTSFTFKFQESSDGGDALADVANFTSLTVTGSFINTSGGDPADYTMADGQIIIPDITAVDTTPTDGFIAFKEVRTVTLT